LGHKEMRNDNERMNRMSDFVVRNGSLNANDGR
jgi:hypothetical protein